MSNINEVLLDENEEIEEVEFDTLKLRDRRRERRQHKRKLNGQLKAVTELMQPNFTREIHRGPAKEKADNPVVGYTKQNKYSNNSKVAKALKKKNNKAVRVTDVPQRGGYKKAGRSVIAELG